MARRVKDKWVLRLIGRYLRAGMMEGGVVSPRGEGSPEGAALSPLLSSVLLDELNKELERRGHRFVRYAGDFRVCGKSKTAGGRVMAPLECFLEKRLRLKVNREKSAVGRPWKWKFLGYRTTTHRTPKLKPDPESVKRLNMKLKELFRRSRGWSLARTIRELNPVVRGWGHCYRLAETDGSVEGLDQLDPATTAPVTLAAVEAGTDPAPGTPGARSGQYQARGSGLQRIRPLAQCQGQSGPPGRSVQHVWPDGTREPSRAAEETYVHFVNRRIRNRTSGGVGGRRP